MPRDISFYMQRIPTQIYIRNRTIVISNIIFNYF